ncbi:hypothetical protein [Roseateles sp.]|uniref:hypothetical protein n=1 Tax=Roseateles sp. TaxID=1971397 RepID=UPI003D122321
MAAASAKPGAKRALTPQDKGIGLPAAVLGRPYSKRLDAQGGSPPYRYLLLNGDLETAGLTLSPDGMLAGVPVLPGPLNFRVAVLSDAEGGRAATQRFRLQVLAAPQPPAQASAALPARDSGDLK